MSDAPQRLRELIDRPGMLIAPGVYDCITARLVQRAGFEAIYMSGSGTAAAAGFPDYGLTTMTEMVGNLARISTAVDVPIIADGDTGFGSELNAVRAIREYTRAGAAAIHIEDQVFPKRCGHLENKEVVDVDDWLIKIETVAAHRPNPKLLLIARTDARAVDGLDEAVRRANQALKVGADIAFVEAPQSLHEVEAIPKLVDGPCLLNVVQGGRTPTLNLHDAERWGYKLAIVPSLLVTAFLAAGQQVLESLREDGEYPDLPSAVSVQERFRIFGSEGWDSLRRTSRSGSETTT